MAESILTGDVTAVWAGATGASARDSGQESKPHIVKPRKRGAQQEPEADGGELAAEPEHEIDSFA